MIIHLSIYLSIHLSIHLSICPSVCHRALCLSFYLSVRFVALFRFCSSAPPAVQTASLHPAFTYRDQTLTTADTLPLRPPAPRRERLSPFSVFTLSRCFPRERYLVSVKNKAKQVGIAHWNKIRSRGRLADNGKCINFLISSPLPCCLLLVI